MAYQGLVRSFLLAGVRRGDEVMGVWFVIFFITNMLASIKKIQPFLHTTEILLLIEKDIFLPTVIHNLEIGIGGKIERKKKKEEKTRSTEIWTFVPLRRLLLSIMQNKSSTDLYLLGIFFVFDSSSLKQWYTLKFYSKNATILWKLIAESSSLVCIQKMLLFTMCNFHSICVHRFFLLL